MRKIRDVLRYRHTTDSSLDAITGALKVSKGSLWLNRPLHLAQQQAVPTGGIGLKPG